VSIRGADALRLLLSVLFLLVAVRAFLHQNDERSAQAPVTRSKERLPLPAFLLRLAAAHSLLLVLLVVASLSFGRDPATALVHGVTVYIFAYVIGVGMVTVLAATLRGIAEHRRLVPDADPYEGEAANRTLHCNWLTALIFGAWGFSEHAAHHAEPGIPSYHLPAVTAVLAGQSAAFAYGPGYLTILARLVLQPRDDRRRSS
jgi:fatty acid desaturase